MNEKQRLEQKYGSALKYVLTALIPYTEANLKLSFKPNLFFNDLEKLDKIKVKKRSLENAYYRAIKKNLVQIDERGIPRLTDKGLQRVEKYQPKKLKGSKLLVIFDIPEADRSKRNRLRTILKELGFEQIQKSVWMSDKDHVKILKAEIKESQLAGYVEVFEARNITPK